MEKAEKLRKQIVSLDLSLKASIQDIQNCLGPMEELNELSQQGRKNIANLRSCINEFKLSAMEEIRVNEKLALDLETKSIEEEFHSTVAAFQKANVKCMLNIEKRAREQLLGLNDDSLVRHRKKRDKEELVKMSSNVTDRLLSISRTLADSTERSASTLGSLVTSSGTLDSTRGELDSQGSVISQSGKLLAKYGRREQTDKFLILLAFAFFFACVFYILHKRLF